MLEIGQRKVSDSCPEVRSQGAIGMNLRNACDSSLEMREPWVIGMGPEVRKYAMGDRDMSSERQ